MDSILNILNTIKQKFEKYNYDNEDDSVAFAITLHCVFAPVLMFCENEYDDIESNIS